VQEPALGSPGALRDVREHTDAADRNKGPILEVLARVLPRRGLVLEIASGTGQHVVHFAQALPHLTWQPSDASTARHGSVIAWTAHERLANVRPPIVLDVRAWPWPLRTADAIVCINLIHVAPWAATLALLDGAARVLPHGGVLFLYGPYRRGGRHTAGSNAAFDADLRARDPAWGLRDVESVSDEASARGLACEEIVQMPINNLAVMLRRSVA
jgi:SAM-dependent methyltransferase